MANLVDDPNERQLSLKIGRSSLNKRELFEMPCVSEIKEKMHPVPSQVHKTCHQRIVDAL